MVHSSITLMGLQVRIADSKALFCVFPIEYLRDTIEPKPVNCVVKTVDAHEVFCSAEGGVSCHLPLAQSQTGGYFVSVDIINCAVVDRVLGDCSISALMSCDRPVETK